MNPDGSNQTRLTNNHPADDVQPAWSPDGKKIAFTSNRDGNFEIYVMNADGSNQVRLTNDPAFEDSLPAWAPDQTKIAFKKGNFSEAEIYVMNADGSNQMRLTNNAIPDTHPDWSPDGSKIAFVSGSGFYNTHIWVMNADGSNPTEITVYPAEFRDPDWSPDGTKIASVIVGPTDATSIGVWSVDGSFGGGIIFTEPHDPYGATCGQPVWSPDGTKIAFVTDRDHNSEIYVMNADGSNQMRLTNLSAEDITPDWQRLVFSCVAPPANIIAWLTGDGNANDIAGANNGTLIGGAAFGSGEVAQAFTFTGGASAVRLPKAALQQNSGAFTVDAWI
jgi:Tol biopolymer transport system component